MNTQDIKQAIANKMLSEYDRGNDMVDLTPLENELGIPWHNIATTITLFHRQGIVEPVVGNTHARLTSYGVAVLEPRDIGVPKQPPQTVNNNFSGSFNQSAIATSGGQASVSIQNTEVNHYFQQLEKAIDQSHSIPPEQKSKWKANLWEMSKHPGLVAALGAVLGG
ncbi:hypothetical protein [Vreelandella venusta]|uniref:hypothetical protein n=1 Tax=Vreelandella venusta TaxID=44935 RepID=UPI00200BBF7C|nr:hypothetical protein [Halomonas venusta]UQI40952.1 hypothetical protein M3L73_01450 [Halomonas venusta]